MVVQDLLKPCPQNGSRFDQDSKGPHCSLKMLPLPHFRYHMTDDQCVLVASLLVESVDTAM